jgi:vitamin B12/bleomycin/antimicrobial peptide transport system ATP-binding/permease protein
MTSPRRHAWSSVVTIARPYFVSPRRWQAAGALAIIVALLLLLNALNVVNSYVGQRFITAISRRDRERYVTFAGLYLCVFAASTLTGVFSQFVQDRLALSWRAWLTRILVDRYLSGHTFERIRAKREIDNPDQRISEDVRTFTSTLLSFVVMIVNAVLTTIAFAGILWSITPTLLFAAVFYAILGSLVTVLLGHRLVHLNNLQLKKEADLRYGLIHVREHALAPGAQAEANDGRRVRARLRRVIHNSRSIIGVNRNVGFFTSGYNYLVQLLPILIVAPRYLRGEIDFGVVTQSAMAFAQLLGAFSLIVAQFQSISTFAAVIRRLGTLWDEMDTATERPSHVPSSSLA